MMKMPSSFLFLLPLLLAVDYCMAQEVTFSPTDWQDPAVFEKGQTAPHAFHVPFSTPEAALANDVAACDTYQLLNGRWKFSWSPTPAQAPAGFWEPAYDASHWDDISVPSNWQMEGYGHPKFRNIPLSFESDPPRIPEYYNPVGCYKRSFTIPGTWNDKAIMLRFEGIKSASYVWVNGRQVGYNQGGFEPAEYDITSFVQPGENDLSVQVIRFCDGAYLENQDMWRLSGIYRDVMLYAQAKTLVRDHYVVTDLDENYRDAVLTITSSLENRGTEKSNVTLEIDVLDAAGLSVLSGPVRSAGLKFDAGSTESVALAIPVKEPKKWSAEYPNLYTLLLHLQDERGQTLEAFTRKIGFREVEYKDQLLTVNGVPVKLNGINSHMHHPEKGQAVPLETLRQDLLIMKRFNINCVRTSHYPPTPEYLSMADDLGIYVVDEVGDEAHGNIYLSEDPAWMEMYQDRSRKLVYRDRNHPSVIIWSAGNESGSGENIKAVIETGKAIDPSRPAWMYGGNRFYIPFEDIVGPRYWIPLHLRSLIEGEVLPAEDRRASFMDEYLAATGNGLGGMDEYWALIRKHPRSTGGAIWDYVSPAVVTPRWIAPDLSPAKNDGQIMGRPVFTEGKNGRGLEFSGHDDWIEFYRHPSLDITGREIAIGFWVKPYKIPQPNTFLAKGKFQYGIHLPDPQTLEFYVHTNERKGLQTHTRRIAATAKVADDFYDKWHHIAGIYDGRTVQLYLDDQLVAETAFSGDMSTTPFPLCIGREAETQDQGEYSGRLSKMIIDDVKIHDRALTLADLRSTSATAVLALDFETDRQAGAFYAVGLGGRTYGVIWPDRTVQPEIHQIKKSGQPVAFKLLDAEKGVIRITNFHHFKNLHELAGSWSLQIDGEVTQRGALTIELPPGKSKDVVIPFAPVRTAGEQLLLVSFQLKEPTEWAGAGHEIAWEQFLLPSQAPAAAAVDLPAGRVQVDESETEFRISGGNFSYIMNKISGQLTSLRFDGVEYLVKGPEFTVWRAPTANAVDPWGAYFFNSRQLTEGYGRSTDNQLRTLGMRDLRIAVDDVAIVQEGGAEVVIELQAWSASSFPPSTIMSWGQPFSAFERRETWTFSADGSIELVQRITPYGPMPDLLPREGLRFLLPKAFRQVEWYGRRPFETYPDRKTGAKIGIYRSDADRLYEPYILPQDHGNRTDVRWLKVYDAQGRGLLISSASPLNFSLHKYSTDNLSRAVYTYQLQEAPHGILHVDYRVSGVGGTAVRQLQPYRVQAREGVYSLQIKPF